MATPAEQLLLQHPGNRALVIPKTKAALARELEAAGLVRLSVARTGVISLSLTEAGQLRREELRLESMARAEPPTPDPPPATPRRPTKAAKPAPTKRAASLDDLFGQGAFKAAQGEDRPVTVADLNALEERLVARFRQLLEETSRR